MSTLLPESKLTLTGSPDPPMRRSVDDGSVGAGIVPGHHGVPARRRTGMNPARLLMPTSPARIALSPGPRRVHTLQVKTYMTTTGITQTRLVMAAERRAVARIQSRRAGRRFRRRMPERS